MNKLITVFLLIFSASVHSKEDSTYLSAAFSQCMEFSTHNKITYCSSNVYSKSEAMINEKYQSLLKNLKGDDKTRFIDSQNKWLAFRDADCLFADPRVDKAYVCLAMRSLERLKTLENYNSAMGCNGCAW